MIPYKLRAIVALLALIGASQALNSQSYPISFVPLDYNSDPVYHEHFNDSWEHNGKKYFVSGAAGNRKLYLIEDGEAKRLFYNRHSIDLIATLDDGFFLQFERGRLVFWNSNSDTFEEIIAEGFVDRNYRSNSEGLFFIQRIENGGDMSLFYSKGTSTSTNLLGTYPFIHNIQEDGYQKASTLFNDQLIYSLDGDNHTIYISDGTPEGTSSLVDLDTYKHGREGVFRICNGKFYFRPQILTVSSHIFWESDGTAENTFPIARSGESNGFITIDDVRCSDTGITFRARKDDINEYQYWRIDTDSMKYVHTNPPPRFEENQRTPKQVGDKLIFRSQNSLWVSDLGYENSKELIDFSSQAEYNSSWKFGTAITVLENGDIYFSINSNTEDEYTLFHLDKDNTLTELFQAEARSWFSFYPGQTILYFTNKSGIYTTDGTKEGTILLTPHSTEDVIVYDDIVFYNYVVITGSQYDRYSAVSNGTLAGTIDLPFFMRDPELSYKSEIEPNKLIFYGNDEKVGQSMWQFDMWKYEASRVADLFDHTDDSNLSLFRSIDSGLLIYNHSELHISDGTVKGTKSLGVRAYNYLLEAGPIFYMISGQNLIASDGTIEGTDTLHQNITVAKGREKYGIIEYQGRYWFFGDDDRKISLYSTDGTLEGTRLEVADDLALSRFNVSGNTQLTTYKNKLLFINRSITGSPELWVSDGTPNGTEVYLDSLDYYIKSFNKVDNKIFIPTLRSSLYVLDGSSDEPTLLHDNLTILDYNRVDLNGIYIFREKPSFVNADATLWRSDGTVEGTYALRNANDIGWLRSGEEIFDGKLYFTDRMAGVTSMWATDGTIEGSYEVFDDAEVSRNFTSATILDSTYYFISNGRLWNTKGVKGEVYEMVFDGFEMSYIGGLTGFRNTLFLTGQSRTYGREIFYITEGGNIAGRVYHDENRNGVQDHTEKGIPDVRININKSQYAFSDVNGNYALQASEGVTYISPEVSGCWELSSDPGEYEFTIERDTLFNDLNFGLSLASDTASVKLDINSSRTRCGFTIPAWVSIKNNGCKILNGKLEVTIDESVTLDSVAHIDFERKNNKIIFDIEDLDISQFHRFKVFLQMPNEEFVGEEISIDAKYITEEDEVLKEYGYSSVISCAIDPNDKQVLPSRDDPDNNNYTEYEEYLKYVIRFQNTGNDTALNVKVIDTLSRNLDLSTFEVLAASHDYTLSLSEEGSLAFSFNNIFLPDSTANEPESHGFVSFKIKVKESIDELTKISNSVGIYFDFNKPIITNTVSSTIVEDVDFDKDGSYFWFDCNDSDRNVYPGANEIDNNDIDEDCNGEDIKTNTLSVEEIQLLVYPNPTSDILNINTPIDGFNYKIFDLLGNVIRNGHIVPKTKVNLSVLPAGVYLLQISSIELNATINKRIVKAK